ncbi:MAG: glycosyltransferase family 4 protein [Bacteroidetes bacterium]|nr:glycosyltransferase family 4 protein [Bacteroidota bacterium]MCW5895851.1 glycosyltransferase family 4 protein [Bacteroidota bacterium]
MSVTKRVLIYSEYWSTRGGGEKYMLAIGETLLRAGYEVTLIAQTASFDKDAVSRYFKIDIEAARVHLVDGDLNMLRQHAEEMSGGFDVCFYITNYRFFRSRAHQTFAVLQIPYGHISRVTILVRMLKGDLKEAAKDFLRRDLLKRLHETQAVLVYSKFVSYSLNIIHDIPSTILEPAIDDFLVEGTPKERVILSVGRFFRGLYNDKRYDILIETFKQLYKQLPNTTWQYRLVGSCGSDEASQRYLDELRAAADGLPIYFHVNTPYEDLKRHYNEATIFWHAAGFGVDEQRHPERAEHFGMSTIEAMSAGCVPVVVNRGGQKEIVSHGKTGYLWSSVDELVEHSLSLIADQPLLSSMQTHVRERFRDFGKDRFVRKLLAILEP